MGKSIYFSNEELEALKDFIKYLEENRISNVDLYAHWQKDWV